MYELKYLLEACIKRTGVGIEAVNYRTMLRSDVKTLADVYDREGIPAQGVPIDMALGWADHVGADGFILMGYRYKNTQEYLEIADKMDLKKPILVGGSVKEDNIYEILDHCDGAVISSSLMLEDALSDSYLHWDVEKIKRFSEKVRNYMK